MDVSEPKLTSSGPQTKREVLTELVGTYASVLLAYCSRHLRDRHLAEDAVQEVFFRAYRRPEVQEVVNVSAWLFGTARHCCQEITRRRRRLHSGGAVPEDLSDRPDPRSDSSDDLSLALDKALDGLDDAERALIYMKHTRGLKCREISEATGEPVGTVTARLSRAYGRLRSLMRKQEG